MSEETLKACSNIEGREFLRMLIGKTVKSIDYKLLLDGLCIEAIKFEDGFEVILEGRGKYATVCGYYDDTTDTEGEVFLPIDEI